MEASIAWKESTQKIFWGVIVIAVAGIISVLYDYVSYGVSIFEFVAQYMPGGNSGMQAFFTSIHTLGFLAKLAVMVGYVLYLLGLTRFAALQTNAAAAQNIQKVRTAVIILICCFATAAVFGVLFSIPFLGTLISIVVWVATLVAYFKMRNAFQVLMASPALSATSQKGARKLRYAAVCNIWLMLMPIVVALAFGVLALLALAVLKGGSDPTAFLYIGGFIGIATIICALVFAVFAFIYPFIGWYQIMNGGPGDETLTNATEIEQRMADIPTTDEQMPALRAKGEQALASAKTWAAQAQEALAPKWEQAKAWTLSHQKPLGIGATAVAVVALAAWLIPKLIPTSAIEFETYEVMDNIQATIDIPQGSSDRAQNVAKGLREIIANANLCSEAIGALGEGTLREVIDDANRRYGKFTSDYMRDNESPIAPICQLFISCVYQNKVCAVFQVEDGVYFNGSPASYFRIVRFSDGHVMEAWEMMDISREVVGELAQKYQTVEDLPVYLDEGFDIMPAATDSCRIAWPLGNGYGDAIVPLSEVEQYLTDEGRELFTTKAVSMPDKKTTGAGASSDETAETDSSGETSYSQQTSTFVGRLPEGTKKYHGEMNGLPIEFNITKTSVEVTAFYRNIKFGGTMNLKGDAGPDEEGNATFIGQDAQGNEWSFHLGGQEGDISGYANGVGKTFGVIFRD